MKLIISDLDGTLLQRGEVSINKNIKNSIYSLLCKGNIFAVASGRSYVELKSLLGEFENDIYFICSDGSLGVYKESTFFSKPLNKDVFRDFTKYTAHGKYLTYVKAESKMFIREVMNKYRGHVMIIDSADEINDEIYKVTDFDKKIKCDLPLVYKDYTMNEYIAPKTDKAMAVRKLTESLGIPKEKTYVFGDNINDICMFKECGTSYAVASALPEVKKCADRITLNIENELAKLA